MSSYIISVTAADRVGIVHAVTGALIDLDGNVLELSQTVMRGYFTIILEASFSAPQTREKIVGAIHARGGRYELQVLVTELKDGRPEPPNPSGELFILTVLGDDSPGIVHNIAGALAAKGANIVDLHARVEGSRFSMVMEASVPPELPPAALREELESYGRAHKLEAYVQHENIFAATTEPGPVRIGSPLRSQGESLASH